MARTAIAAGLVMVQRNWRAIGVVTGEGCRACRLFPYCITPGRRLVSPVNQRHSTKQLGKECFAAAGVVGRAVGSANVHPADAGFNANGSQLVG